MKGGKGEKGEKGEKEGKKERNKKERNKKERKEERADRNRSPSTIARTGPFCYSRAWKPPHSDKLEVSRRRPGHRVPSHP